MERGHGTLSRFRSSGSSLKNLNFGDAHGVDAIPAKVVEEGRNGADITSKAC